MYERVRAILPAPMLRLATMTRRSYRLWRVRRRLAGMPEPEPGSQPVPPPRFLVDWLGIGGGDFGSIGRQFVGYLRDYCDVRDGASVLDVGCGLGRIAVPLAQHLGSEGAYMGIDISSEAIAWCRKTITPLYPNFRFQVSDIHNAAYNPKGRMSATGFTFPCADGAFTCVFAISVFTHMRPAEVECYLEQIARVLRPTGKCLLTFFILNDESTRLIREGKAQFAFAHDAGGCWTANKAVPEAAIAYAEPDLRRMPADAGLDVVEPIRYGSWCGRDNYTSGQDMVIVRRT